MNSFTFVRTIFFAWVIGLLCFLRPVHADEHIRICLVMMVKNETAVIERCLNSVKDCVDCISICNVGSTDDTLSIVEKFMQETHIPGNIHQHEWENCGHNRTLAIETTKKMLQNFGFSLSDTYLLILEPDQLLKVGPKFRKNSLKEEAYRLFEHFISLSLCSYRTRLLKASLSWTCSGIVNEYWYDTPHHCETLDQLSVEEQSSKEYTEAKLKQKLNLLTQALSKDPHHTTYLFHLAQTKKALKHYEEAIQAYKTRIEKGGDKEEVWFSKYMLGECYEEMNQWSEALYWYLEAYQFNPDRAEVLKKIAAFYRLRGENELAYMFAKQGSQIPFPEHPILLSSPPLYDYLFDEELSISAYYTRFKEEGYAAISNLLLKKRVPWHIRENSCKNLLFYIQNLKNASFEPISLDLPLIQEGFEERYHPMNPSIQKIPDGYELICRTVNYTQSGAKIFKTIDLNGMFRTRNFLISYDREFNLISQQEIIENLNRPRFRSFNIEGLEDCRIFNLNNASWFTCTTTDTNPLGYHQISLCKIGHEKNSALVQVEKLIPLKGPDPYRYEKNWLPFIKDNSLLVVYSYDPFIIFKPEIDSGDCKTVVHYEPAHDFSHFRGSAAPLVFDKGYLMLIHEVIYLSDYSRCYTHRFLYLDKDFIVERVSKPFTFLHLGVEYCCSMTLDHSGSRLVMPIGIEDREAYLCFVDLDTIRSMLDPLPPIAHSR